MTTERVLPAPAVSAPVRGAPVAPLTGGEGSSGGADRPRVWSSGTSTARAFGRAAEAAASAAAGSATARAARLVKPRGDAVLSTPTRAGMLIGVSAAVYAVSLASVAGLQAQTVAEAAAQNQPAIDALAQARAANDALAASIGDADTRIRALADQYNSMSQDVGAYQARFEELSKLVATIRGSAAAMSAKIALPNVSIHGSIGGGGGGGTVIVTTSASGKP